MIEDYIPISLLNDFIFCPYSIYLHNVYMDTDTDMYHALPQIAGKIAHRSVDSKRTSTKATLLDSINIVSHQFQIFGKIDTFNSDTGILTERKNHLRRIFQGQIYQLWAQYFCLIEMGYEVKAIEFFEITTRKHISINLPGNEDINAFQNFLTEFRNFNPRNFTTQNPNKCSHCIYCGLCDKSVFDHVY